MTKGAHGRRARAAQEGPEGSPRHFAWLKNEEEPSPACLRQGKVSSSDLIFTSFALVTFELMGAPNENSSFHLGHSDE